MLGISAGAASAGTVSGKIELPPQAPASPSASGSKGYLDRVENPHLPVRAFDPLPYLVVVLVPATPAEAPPPTGTTTWDLVGDSFAKPVLPVRAGAEVTIRNKSKRVVTLGAVEDAKLIPAGPINITGTRAFPVKTAGKLTITDVDIPHLKGRLLVLATPHFALPERDGKFEIKDVPAGEYKVRVWYLDGWLDRPDESLTVPEKKDVKVEPKVPAGYKTKAT